jgi:NAD(P)-dependent dehydrogenase (short-subunit alcohol dehydrogenase family)
MARLNGKVILVTGAAQGIGLAVAGLLSKEGGTVIAGDVKNITGDNDFETVHLDVSSEGDWISVVQGILDKLGRIDVLVNNAGIVACYEPVLGTARASWDRVIAVNLTGSFLGYAKGRQRLHHQLLIDLGKRWRWRSSGLQCSQGGRPKHDEERCRYICRREYSCELRTSRSYSHASC